MRPTWDEYHAKVNDHRPGAWPRLQFEAIQTGRTTRMMQEVLRRAANADNMIFVIVPTVDYGRDLHKRWKTPLNVVYSTFNGLNQVLDFERGHLRGVAARGNGGTVEIFVDHAAVEQQFGWLLIQLHRFDGAIVEADKFGNHVV